MTAMEVDRNQISLRRNAKALLHKSMDILQNEFSFRGRTFLLSRSAKRLFVTSMALPVSSRPLYERAGSNQCRVATHMWQTESITGTSTSTPTTVASAAPDPGP